MVDIEAIAMAPAVTPKGASARTQASEKASDAVDRHNESTWGSGLGCMGDRPVRYAERTLGDKVDESLGWQKDAVGRLDLAVSELRAQNEQLRTSAASSARQATVARAIALLSLLVSALSLAFSALQAFLH